MKFKHSKLWYFLQNVIEQPFEGEKEKHGVSFKITADWLEQDGSKINGKYFYIIHDSRLKKYKYLGRDLNSRMIIIKPLSIFGKFVWELKNL